MRKIFVFLLLSSLFVQAQAKLGNPGVVLSRVTFVGSPKYPQQALVDLSGLKIGTPFNTASLNEAANRLASSGIFDDVRYRYNGTTVEFQVTENQDVVPCMFDNFVWYENSELENLIRKRVPLYVGTVPNRGDFSDKISEALEQIVGENGVAVKVSAMPDAQLGGKLTAMVFSVSSPEMKIGQIRFVDVSSGELSTMQGAVKPLLGNDFRVEFLSNYLKSNLLPLYQRDGFFHASTGKITAAVAAITAARIAVDVSVKVVEGDQYRVEAINWAGTDVVGQKDGAKLIVLKAGDIANQDLLRQSLGNIGGRYASKGYLKAKISAIPSIDETQKVVAYDVQVTPGSLYHMGNLEVANMETSRAEKLRQAWKLKSGEVYDPGYVKEFLFRDKQVLPLLDGWSSSVKETINEDTKSVDLVLMFKMGAR